MCKDEKTRTSLITETRDHPLPTNKNKNVKEESSS